MLKGVEKYNNRLLAEQQNHIILHVILQKAGPKYLLELGFLDYPKRTIAKR